MIGDTYEFLVSYRGYTPLSVSWWKFSVSFNSLNQFFQLGLNSNCGSDLTIRLICHIWIVIKPINILEILAKVAITVSCNPMKRLTMNAFNKQLAGNHCNLVFFRIYI